MIPANELRLGNYIQAKSRLLQVMTIDGPSSSVLLESVKEPGSRTSFKLNELEPAALTDELLKQCGFHFQAYFQFWQLISGQNETRSELDIDRDYNIIDFMRRPVVKKVASLHQLQNIYFMLKGKELAFAGH